MDGSPCFTGDKSLFLWCYFAVMGHVLSTGLDLIGTGRNPRLDRQFQSEIDKMVELGSKSNISAREKMHVHAIKQLAQG